jgi:hypothetical protein
LASLASGVLLALGLAASTHAADITTGLTAYWNFDQKNFEDSVGSFDGTENGDSPIEFVAGKTGFGQAIRLLGPADSGGANQYVEITGGEPDDLAFADGSMSVSLWFTVDAWDKSWQAVCAKGEGDNWRIHRRGAENVMGFTGGAGGDTPSGTTDVTGGGWHHLVAISDNTTLTSSLWIDGVLDASRDIGALTANGLRMMIGENPAARNRYWHGLVDDVAIWDRPLTEAEIASLWSNGAGKPLSAFFIPPTDTDNDGMTDEWETQYASCCALNPNDASDAAKDCNGNGITNLDEFKRGLNPCDTAKPTIVSAVSTASFDTVIITFSEALDPATATVTANYTITPALAVTAATYKNKVVTLTTAPQTPGATAYTVEVKGVKDMQNWEVPAGTKAIFYSYVMTRSGVLEFSYWDNISGTPVQNLYDDPRYPASPTMVGAVYSFNSRDIFPDDSHDNFGATMEGYITPTESGDYRFFIYSDDASQLFLGVDDQPIDPLTSIWIAEEPGCCNNFSEPDGLHTRTSEPISLVAGRKYSILLVYKEGGGGDYGQVAWRKEGDPTPAAQLRPIPGDYLSSAVSLPAPPSARTYGIGLNFGADEANGTLAVADKAGVTAVSQANWNNLSLLNGTSTTVVADAAGASQTTAATVTWASANTWASTGRGEENNNLTGANRTLMTGYLDTGAATTTTVTIENLPTALTTGGYDVYVYLLGGVPAKGGGYRIVDATSGAVLKDYVKAQCSVNPAVHVRAIPSGTEPATGTYLLFSGLASANIKVEASTANGLGFGSNPRAPINAIQLVTPPTSPPAAALPTLSATRTATGLTITFSGRLQSADTVLGPWTDVAGATSPASIQATGPAKYFRSAQ